MRIVLRILPELLTGSSFEIRFPPIFEKRLHN